MHCKHWMDVSRCVLWSLSSSVPTRSNPSNLLLGLLLLFFWFTFLCCSLPHLETLNIDFNRVTSLAPLVKLSTLRTLHAAHNKIASTVGIPDLVETVTLSENPLRELQVPFQFIFLFVDLLCLININDTNFDLFRSCFSRLIS